MIDSSVLPATIIQTVATLYSVFAAVFIFVFEKHKKDKNDKKDIKYKRYKIFMITFGLLSFIVFVALICNCFILYLLHNGKFNEIPKFFQSDWSVFSYCTFIISSGFIFFVSKQLLNYPDDTRYDLFDFLIITSIGLFMSLVLFPKSIYADLLTIIIFYPLFLFLTKFISKQLPRIFPSIFS